MSVKIVKLITGEELIASVSETSSSVSIAEAAVIILGANPLNNQPKVSLMPWAMFTKTGVVTVDKRHIIYIEDPDEQLYNHYSRQFGSGLVIPENV